MPRTVPALVAALALALAFALPRPAPAAPDADAGFDALLSEYRYPYPVLYRAFDEQRQALRMAYMLIEPAAGKPRHTVLLLHGKNFSGAYWKTTIEALTQRGHRVIVPDQIGFGKSSKPTDFQYTFHALAEHTRDLLDDLGADKVVVVGHSMGGMLATRFALAYPERTEKLVLVNPIGLEDWQQVVPYMPVDGWFAQNLKTTPETVKSYMQAAYFDGKWRPDYDPLLAIQAGWAAGPHARHIAYVSALHYDMIFTQPVVHDFPRLKAPTLLIIGTRDKTALGRDRAPEGVRKTLGDYGKLGKTAAAAIPGARLVELPGVGHVPQFEALDRYVEALAGFVDGK